MTYSVAYYKGREDLLSSMEKGGKDPIEKYCPDTEEYTQYVEGFMNNHIDKDYYPKT